MCQDAGVGRRHGSRSTLRPDGRQKVGNRETSSLEVVFAKTLTTTGTSDGSVPTGDITWFYALDRTHGGAWRIAGGGSGP